MDEEYKNPSNQEFEAIIAGLQELKAKIRKKQKLDDSDKMAWRRGICFWRKVNTIDDDTFEKSWLNISCCNKSPVTLLQTINLMRRVYNIRNKANYNLTQINHDQKDALHNVLEFMINNSISLPDHNENLRILDELMSDECDK